MTAIAGWRSTSRSCNLKPMGSCIVRDPTPADEPLWRALWDGYNHHYRATIPAAVTDATWARIVDLDPTMHTRLAEADGAVVGFANVILHVSTWRLARDAYLEDLFVAESLRGRRIGAALLDDLIARCHAHGWTRLSWHTATENAAARRLYDRYILAEPLVRYRLHFT